MLLVLCFGWVLFIGKILGLNSGSEIVYPHDKFKCKLSWDLPIGYTNATEEKPYEYGQYVWDGERSGDNVTFNPFTSSFDSDPHPHNHHDVTLDCPSGIALNRPACEGLAQPACDAFCEYMCLSKCSMPGKAPDLINCLQQNGLAGCIYNVQHTHWVKARACRKEFDAVIYQYPHLSHDGEDDSTTESDLSSLSVTENDGTSTIAVLNALHQARGRHRHLQADTTTSVTSPPPAQSGILPLNSSSMTIYVIEVLPDHVGDVNWKRVVRATLSLALETEYILDPISPDFGNLIDLTSGYDITSCNVPFTDVIYSPLDRPDRLIHTPHLGASYVVKKSESPPMVMIDSHITSIISSSALQGYGGYPNQFTIWWPGKQPMLAGGLNVRESDIYLKVTFQGYSAHYLSTNGFVVLPNFSTLKCSLSLPMYIYISSFVLIMLF